jgi:hypothetical protein
MNFIRWYEKRPANWKICKMLLYLLEHFGNLAGLKKLSFNIISKFIRLSSSLNKAEMSSNNLGKLSLKNGLNWKTILPANY